MPQLITPKTKVRVISKEGEIEITLNINITVDGKVATTVDPKNVTVNEDEDKVPYVIPDFTAGPKLNFGRNERA